MDRQELSDAVWERMAPHLPGKATDPGRTGRDNRLFVEAILWLARSGAHWRVLPKEFGRWHTVYQRFNRWCRNGVWERLFKALSDDADFEYILVDSTIVRAHQHSACPKKSDRSEDRFEAHALGRSKGGLSTKVHAATDALGNPVRFILTGGERNDITQIEGLLDGLRADHVLADKGYDGQRAMKAIAATGAQPVVPRRTTTAQWRAFDATLYKDRNLIERFFNKIKHFRRIATRYDKLARNYAGFLNLVAALKCCI
nr:IS5 family transposase [Sphingopyxis indica]